ncbi:MAG: SRPBCC family protein [Actinomycetes bacterium]
MFSTSVEISVHRPLFEVFTYVADARNHPEWDKRVISEELTSPEPIGVGSTVHTRFRFMGRELQYDWAVTEYQRSRTMTIQSTSGPVPATLVYDLAPSGYLTWLRLTVIMRPSGLMRLLQPWLARDTQKTLDRNFSRLRDVLDQSETGHPA